MKVTDRKRKVKLNKMGNCSWTKRKVTLQNEIEIATLMEREKIVNKEKKHKQVHENNITKENKCNRKWEKKTNKSLKQHVRQRKKEAIKEKKTR